MFDKNIPTQLLAIPKSEISVQARTQRLTVIDMLRGFAMIVMALEHSAFFSQTNYSAETLGHSKPNLSSTLHIIIGLITNSASGIFFFLAGTSVAFFEKSRRKQGWTDRQITEFLLVRALILAVLDRIISRYGWHQSILTFDVLSAIAFALVVLSVVRLLSLRIIAIAAVILFFGYPLLVTTFPFDPNNPILTATAFLYQYHTGSAPYIEFAALSRLSIVLMGYVIGRLLVEKRIVITGNVFWLALAVLLAAGLLRIIGGYGNFSPYHQGQPFIYFFIESKQPPSVVFLLFNIAKGLALVGLLRLFANRFPDNFLERIMIMLGQTSLFFYAAHLLVLSYIVSKIIPPTFLGGHSIARDLLMWGLTMAILIPMCAGYRELRKRYPRSILQYL